VEWLVFGRAADRGGLLLPGGKRRSTKRKNIGKSEFSRLPGPEKIFLPRDKQERDKESGGDEGNMLVC